MIRSVVKMMQYTLISDMVDASFGHEVMSCPLDLKLECLTLNSRKHNERWVRGHAT